MKYRINRYLILFWMSWLTHIVSGQKLLEPVKAFVGIGHEVIIERYQNPVLVNNKMINYGQFLDSDKTYVRMGSGIIVSRDGLVLTTYQICNFQEKVEVNKENTLTVIKRANKDLFVWELDDDKLFEPAQVKYLAAPISCHKNLDLSLIQITRDFRTGQELNKPHFDVVKPGNPFAIKKNEPITISGFFDNRNVLMITSGNFKGYLPGETNHYSQDGAMICDAALTPGHSGAAAIYGNTLIGIVSVVMLPGASESFFSYIHPITWATGSFVTAKIEHGSNPPEIPLNWLTNDFNTDVTRTGIYVTGNVNSAQASLPVSNAMILLHRSDRTTEQIINLFTEITGFGLIMKIHQHQLQGYSVEKLARRFQMSPERIMQFLNVKIDHTIFSDDALKFIDGEFFFASTSTDSRGFFILTAPRNMTLNLFIARNDYRRFNKKIKTEKGVYQNLGRIKIIQY